MNRKIANIYCSCGGQPSEVDTTDKEEELYGCQTKGCCVRAYTCSECNTRWLFELNAPEMDWV